MGNPRLLAPLTGKTDGPETEIGKNKPRSHKMRRNRSSISDVLKFKSTVRHSDGNGVVVSQSLFPSSQCYLLLISTITLLLVTFIALNF